jgi:hypothetical protein
MRNCTHPAVLTAGGTELAGSLETARLVGWIRSSGKDVLSKQQQGIRLTTHSVLRKAADERGVLHRDGDGSANAGGTAYVRKRLYR